MTINLKTAQKLTFLLELLKHTKDFGQLKEFTPDKITFQSLLTTKNKALVLDKRIIQDYQSFLTTYKDHLDDYIVEINSDDDFIDDDIQDFTQIQLKYVVKIAQNLVNSIIYQQHRSQNQKILKNYTLIEILDNIKISLDSLLTFLNFDWDGKMSSVWTIKNHRTINQIINSLEYTYEQKNFTSTSDEITQNWDHYDSGRDAHILDFFGLYFFQVIIKYIEKEIPIFLNYIEQK